MEMTIFVLIVLLFSIVIHEVAHGSVANMLGDPTAKQAGRLTLNPLKHLDLFGSIILPIIGLLSRGLIFGWAKPVPINPFNFRDQKRGMLKVSLAGPAANFLIAVIFGLAIRFFKLSSPFFDIIVYYNFALGIFNLIPVPPLDGHHVLFALLGDKFFGLKIFLQQYGLIILLVLIFTGLNWIASGAGALYGLTTGRP